MTRSRLHPLAWAVLVVLLVALAPLASLAAQAQAPAAPVSPVEAIDAPTVTRHVLPANDAHEALGYTAAAGFQPVKDVAGTLAARMFYIAYTLDATPDPATRPITFVFNGGPGSSAIWLHLGAVGPKRVELTDLGLPVEPHRLADNPDTWLDRTDLVLIDPVGAGLSRAEPGVDAAQFWDVTRDADSFEQFIRGYLAATNRRGSPIYLAGESYGGTRAVLLARRLQVVDRDRGRTGRAGNPDPIKLAGLVLISPVLHYETLNARPTDLALALDVPSYAATAWYHKKLAPELQGDLPALLREVEAWSVNRYLPALVRGDALPENDRARVAAELSRYTGIPAAHILERNLQLTPGDFSRTLLSDRNLGVSRFDSRVTVALRRTRDYIDVLVPTFAPLLESYLAGDLGVRSDERYVPLLSEASRRWNWGPGGLTGFLNVTPDLRDTMQANPAMKILVALGYYDVNVPYYGTEYALNQLELPPDLRAQITRAYYESGHTVDMPPASAAKLKADVAAWMGG